MPDNMTCDAEPQEVRVQPLQLRGYDADILAALRHLNAVDALHAHGIGQCMGVGADTADALDQNESLDGVALGGELLYAAMVIADKDLRVLDDLALGIELCVYRLLKRGMVRADGDNVAHFVPSSMFFCRSSESGMTIIWPLPCVSSMSSGRKSRCDTSSPSNSIANSSLSSRSGHVAAVS